MSGIFTELSEENTMIKRFGALFFFVLIFIAALGIANALSITFYEKSLITVIKDFIFILTRK